MFGGKIMDTFMDKLASRLNAQEMIRANSQAEAKENERLNKEVEVYKQCLEQMREILGQNTGAYDDVAELVKVSMDKIALIQAESGKSDEVLEAMEKRTAAVMNAIAGGSDEVVKAVSGNTDAVMGALSGNSNKVIDAVTENTDKILTELSGFQTDNDGLKEAIVQEVLVEIKKELKALEENVHKECVKVYRNVQAVVTEDNDKQTKMIIDNQTKMKKKASAALVCGILAMSFAAAGLVVSVLDVLGVFAMLF